MTDDVKCETGEDSKTEDDTDSVNESDVLESTTKNTKNLKAIKKIIDEVCFHSTCCLL